MRFFKLKVMLIASGVILLQELLAAAPCPCDIYAAGGTPCCAAHSMVRALYSTYNGPLYQIRRESDNAVRDINTVGPGGLSNAAGQDSFLVGTAGKVTIIYDQSGNKNNLTRGPAGSACSGRSDSLSPPNSKISLGGKTVYGLYMRRDKPAGWGDGYRNDSTKGIPTGSKLQGLYWVIGGKRFSSGCCWDYGNAETKNNAGPVCSMQALYFGNTAYWGTGTGTGPWIMADLEQGVYSGGTSLVKNYASNPSLSFDFVSAFLKGGTSTYTLKYGNAQSGNLTVIYDGNAPNTWKLEGAIILGTGGDNSCGGTGDFFEAAITDGRPDDSTENAVQQNIIAAGYSQATPTRPGAELVKQTSRVPFGVHYDASSGKVVISYTVQDSRRITMNIFTPQGRHVVALFDGVVSAGRHEEVWNTKRVHAGAYICRIASKGMEKWAGKIIVGE